MARASQPDKLSHPNFLSDGQRSPAVSLFGSRPPAEHRPNPFFYPPIFSPAWRGLHVRGFFSLPARRGDPSDIVVLNSHQTSAKVSRLGSYTCHPQVRHIHSMPWVLCSRRMSREPPCRMSQTIFICQADKTLSSGDGVLCSGRRLHEPSQPDNHPLSSE